jgi:hypothetical protein
MDIASVMSGSPVGIGAVALQRLAQFGIKEEDIIKAAAAGMGGYLLMTYYGEDGVTPAGLAVLAAMPDSARKQAIKQAQDIAKVTGKNVDELAKYVDTPPKIDGNASFNQGTTPNLSDAPATVAGKEIRKQVDMNSLKELSKKKGYDFNKIESEAKIMIEKSKEQQGTLHQKAKDIVNSTPDTIFAPGPIKKIDRILEKTIVENEGDLSKTKDIARNTIIPLTEKARKSALEKMLARKDIDRHKAQLPENFAGYRGDIFNVKLPNGTIAETQVVSPQMTFGKNSEEFSRTVLGDELFEKIMKKSNLEPGKGHEIYEQIRSLKKTDTDYLSKLKRLEEESRIYYSKLDNIKL